MHPAGLRSGGELGELSELYFVFPEALLRHW